MTRIQLHMEDNPIIGIATLNLRRRDGGYERVLAIIDTGAEVTTLPARLMVDLDYRVSDNGRVEVEQAGIARQSFEVLEAYVEAFLDDDFGNQTEPFETIIWFTTTREVLLGVEKMLDRAILHLDMPKLTGYLEFPE